MVSNPFFTERLKLFLGCARDLLQLLECFKAYEGEIAHKLLQLTHLESILHYYLVVCK